MSQDYHVFISYRRDGGDDLAVLIKDRLTQLGFRVFLDVDSLRSGRFDERLIEVISNCTDFILVLPEHALDRCINDPQDWVRREISCALNSRRNIVPVMKRNFVFPDNLPEDIAGVSKMHGVSANMEDFNSVMNRIVSQRLHSTPEEEDDKALRRRAQEGDPASMNELALRYEAGGSGVISNAREAMRLYRLAAEKGCAAAMYNMADVYERCSDDFSLLGDYGIEVDRSLSGQEIAGRLLEQAVSLYRRAAQDNHAPSLYRLGNLFEQKKDAAQAMAHYRLAAEQSYAPALNALGFFFQNGIGCAQDLALAEEAYHRSADAMYAPGVYNYAMLLQAKEPKTALNLLRRIAFGDHALPMATYALGRLYETCYRDLRNASSCYRYAADAGVEQALDDLNRLKYQFS